MSLTKGEYRPQLPEQKINLLGFVPNEVKVPNIPEGETILTIISCKIIPCPQGYKTVRERIEVDFIDEEKRQLRQIFYRDTGMVNFVKFVDDILGEVPSEDFDLNFLIGIKIKAIIYHNYLNNGKGYANIAFCEFYDQSNSEGKTR
ncbi:hypothetical protein [Neobacillus sp.]|uniref:hypothetical protein n=1 Tax=Neobacillus sp. TaxID=2675273 RepID=UPI0035B50546